LYKSAKKTKWRLQNKPFPAYAGHQAVDRSINAGLTQLNVPFNYNPKQLREVAQHVHVLASIDALKMAIDLKRNGKIKRLTAGVNLVISSADHGGIIASPEIDTYTVNSPWIKDFYIRENLALKDRVEIWYAGIEHEYWDLKKKLIDKEKPRFLFYLKRPEYILVDECTGILQQHGFEYATIEYGKYSLGQLKQSLAETDFAVYFVEQESQGIALFEIWASNTPTFVWNPGYWQYQYKNFRSSSAPYLSDATGQFFRDRIEFENLVSSKANPEGYAPRKWIQEHGSDKKAAEIFLKAIGYDQ
jgi:hypothetical protein